MTTVPQQTQSRPTQSFVLTLTWMRRHPKLLLLEVAWRWIFGAPLLYIAYGWGLRVLATTAWKQTGIEQLSVNLMLTDPMRASTLMASAVEVFTPAVSHALTVAIVPVLLAWAAVSAVGRTLVLRGMDPSMQSRPVTMFVLQIMRVVPTVLSVWLWWWLLSTAANHTVLNGGEPAMMQYVGIALVVSLGLFVLWAALGWIFSIAPIVAMLQGRGALSSLRASLGVSRRVRGGLVEINLVMGVVKLALLVLLMVFTATPLPFQAIATPDFLFWWSAAVVLLYCVVSDFFQVARLAAYLEMLDVSPSSILVRQN